VYRDRALERRLNIATDGTGIEAIVANLDDEQTKFLGNAYLIASTTTDATITITITITMLSQLTLLLLLLLILIQILIITALGGDEEHTHLVRGLDYALLEKKRKEAVYSKHDHNDSNSSSTTSRSSVNLKDAKTSTDMGFRIKSIMLKASDTTSVNKTNKAAIRMLSRLRFEYAIDANRYYYYYYYYYYYCYYLYLYYSYY